METIGKLDVVRELDHAAAVLKGAARDIDDAMLCLRGAIREANIAVRNGNGLNAGDLSGEREALLAAHDAVDAAKKQRVRLDAAVQAAEDQLAQIEYRLAEGGALAIIAGRNATEQENE